MYIVIRDASNGYVIETEHTNISVAKDIPEVLALVRIVMFSNSEKGVKVGLYEHVRKKVVSLCKKGKAQELRSMLVEHFGVTVVSDICIKDLDRLLEHLERLEKEV